MKIHQLKLKNYKSFTEEAFSFNPSFTVLVGDNGKGKSAILDALAIALGGFLVGIIEVKGKLIQRDEIRSKDFGEYIEQQLPTIVAAMGEVHGDLINSDRSILDASGKNTQKGITRIVQIANNLSNSVRDGNTVTTKICYWSLTFTDIRVSATTCPTSFCTKQRIMTGNSGSISSVSATNSSCVF